MMGAMSRRKGKRGELEVVAFYRAEGFEARRGQQFKGSPDSPDVEVPDFPWMHVEVKREEKFPLYSRLEQALRDAGDEKIGVVHHRRSYHEWVVVLRLKDFAAILRETADPQPPGRR